nr:MAG TPA: hypothetical protein [Caudoviricetes sp.]
MKLFLVILWMRALSLTSLTTQAASDSIHTRPV